jgi:hypothetical protein
MKNEKELIKLFIEYLKNNLGYSDDNFIAEKRINNSIIDLLIIDSNSSTQSAKAIIEFKNNTNIGSSTTDQVMRYRAIIGNHKLPCFIVQDQDVYVLESYGWKRILINEFPSKEKLIN